MLGTPVVVDLQSLIYRSHIATDAINSDHLTLNPARLAPIASVAMYVIPPQKPVILPQRIRISLLHCCVLTIA